MAEGAAIELAKHGLVAGVLHGRSMLRGLPLGVLTRMALRRSKRSRRTAPYPRGLRPQRQCSSER